MEKSRENKIDFLEYQIPLEDQFVFERLKRSVEGSENVEAIKMMAIYFAQIATQRNAIIKGLIKDLISPDNIILRS